MRAGTTGGSSSVPLVTAAGDGEGVGSDSSASGVRRRIHRMTAQTAATKSASPRTRPTIDGWPTWSTARPRAREALAPARASTRRAPSGSMPSLAGLASDAPGG